MKNVYTSGKKTIVRPLFSPCFAFLNIFVTSIDFKKDGGPTRPTGRRHRCKPSGWRLLCAVGEANRDSWSAGYGGFKGTRSPEVRGPVGYW